MTQYDVAVINIYDVHLMSQFIETPSARIDPLDVKYT